MIIKERENPLKYILVTINLCHSKVWYHNILGETWEESNKYKDNFTL